MSPVKRQQISHTDAAEGEISQRNVLCFPACDPGRFGQLCAQTCSCPANLLCDRFTGDCVCENRGDDCKQGTDLMLAEVWEL